MKWCVNWLRILFPYHLGILQQVHYCYIHDINNYGDSEECCKGRYK